MNKLPIFAALVVAGVGCHWPGIDNRQQPPRPASVTDNATGESERFRVTLQSEALLKAADDFEYWNGRYANSEHIADRGRSWPSMGTNAFTVIYSGNTAREFTNWLSKSRPVLYDKLFPPKPAKVSRSVPAMLMPPTPQKRARMVSGATQAPPVTVLNIGWEYPDQPQVTFNIYGSANCKDWVVVTNVSGLQASMPIGQPFRMFFVTALDEEGRESVKPWEKQ